MTQEAPGRKQTHISRIAPFGGQKIERPVAEPKPELIAPEPPKATFLRPIEQGTDQQISMYVRGFRFFGCYLKDFVDTKGVKQQQGQCPFPTCRKEEHFFMKPGTGQWDCKKCNRAGNFIEFIRLLHSEFLSQTMDEDYARLAEQRPGISAAVMKHWELAYNSEFDEWMLPTLNADGKATNLHVWREYIDEVTQERRKMLLATPTCKLTLYGMQQFVKDNRKLPLWVLEGHWDVLAFHSILKKMNILDAHRFVGMPGAGTFPKEQLHILTAADVRFLLDNDDAGKNGTERIFTAMGNLDVIPSKLQSISWPTACPEKTDVRDVAAAFTVKDRKAPYHEHKNPLAFFQKVLEVKKLDQLKTENEGYDPDIEPMYCSSFEALVESCSRRLHFTEGLESSLAVLLAINLSVSLGGNHLWAYLVGPPSSGKTTLADIMAASHPYCVSKSKFTGLFSGWKGSRSDQGKDFGMVPKFNNRTLIVKDWTTILALPPGQQEGLFSQLRDAYDGESDVSYLNGVGFNFRNIRFSIIACVTDAIRGWNRSALGERFLHCEIDSTWSVNGTMQRVGSGGDDRILHAMSNTISAVCDPVTSSGKIDLKEPKSLCWGLLESLHHRIENDRQYVKRIGVNVLGDTDFMLYIADLAKWCSLARCFVDRERGQDLSYRPRPEQGDRLASQLTKLAISLCILFQIERPNDKVIDLMRKIALDTSISFPLEIMLHLAHCPNRRGMTKDELTRLTRISTTSVTRWLNDLIEIGIITQGISNGPSLQSGKPQFVTGRPTNLYTFTPEVQELAEGLGFAAGA